MKFYTSKSQLESLLQKLRSVNQSGGSTVRITAEESTAKFDVSGNTIKLSIRANCEIEHPGSAVVGLGVLASISTGLVGDLEVELVDGRLTIIGQSGSSADLPIIHDGFFDNDPKHSDKPVVGICTLTGSQFMAMTRRVANICDPKNQRAWAVGVWLFSLNGKLAFGASEGHIIAIQRTEIETQIDPLTIHDDHLTAVRRLVRDDDDVRFELIGPTIRASVVAVEEPWIATFPVVSELPPMDAVYRALKSIDSNARPFINVKTVELETCCSIASSVDEFKGLSLDSDVGRIVAHQEGSNGKFNRSIMLDSTGYKDSSVMNSRYLSKVLRSLGDETLGLAFCEDPKGLLITRTEDPSYTAFINGMRIA